MRYENGKKEETPPNSWRALCGRTCDSGDSVRDLPVAMMTDGAIVLNYLKSMGAPAGTLSIETNPEYKAAEAPGPAATLVDADWPNAEFLDQRS